MNYRIVNWILLFSIITGSNLSAQEVNITGELKTWHPITLTFTGPETSETALPNPFLNYRLDVVFMKDSKQYSVPGYFAADGRAGESSADAGNQWRVHFTPDEAGVWQYKAFFVSGLDIAIHPDNEGIPTSFDGVSGSFRIEPSDKSGRDFRGKGMLRYVGKRYLQFAGTGEYFIKGGADSPENFLAYADFDQTLYGGASPTKTSAGEADPHLKLHRYEPHAQDWKPGDPTWKNGKGKTIIGALNYLAGKGMNSVYFLTMNVIGDGKDVWPWTAYDERYRFDCSKLDQWEIVFSHMDNVGLMLHVITQETENDQLLDEGELGRQRKLYYRELIARFAHHPALVWNLGEENTNTDEQRKAFARYIHDLDPYDHPVVIHTYPGHYDQVYEPLLGYKYLQGPSLQMGNMSKTHAETLKWVRRSADAGHPWVVCLDEIGPADVGVKPDADDFWHDQVRKEALWGNLMAGGAGCEWYFGYKFAHNDLNCEDWRSRDHMWDLTRHALDFFRQIPFAEMKPDDELTSAENDYCLAKVGEVYAIYLPNGGGTNLNLASGEFSVKWYNPRTGGEWVEGSIKTIVGPGDQSIGNPPADADSDWAVLVTKINK
ncbi:MAG: DUF5060 domain-containing protein [Candidatus Omnitrophota bacterium]|nr:MAG: DUF5060 domain-containing protein [Candidatus Omnitrophota bacterium]